MRKLLSRGLIIIIGVTILFSILAILGISISHGLIFSRADYDEYEVDRLLTYSDIDAQAPKDLNAVIHYIQSEPNLIILQFYCLVIVWVPTQASRFYNMEMI